MLNELNDYVLAVLSAGNGKTFLPIQIQKLFFILDREIPDQIGGRRFDFEPYSYGPFDSKIYHVLWSLVDKDMLTRERDAAHPYRQYRLTSPGQKRGEQMLLALDQTAQQYVSNVVEFVLRLSGPIRIGVCDKDGQARFLEDSELDDHRENAKQAIEHFGQYAEKFADTKSAPQVPRPEK